MLVSIITPVYNSEKYIAQTIESVLAQTYNDWEMLITDDYSSDSTFDIVMKYALIDNRIKIYRLNKNQGPGVARNNSIKYAKGRLIAFCDGDDLWKPDKLEIQVKIHQKYEIGLSFSSYHIVDEDGNIKGMVKALKKATYKNMLRNNYIGCLTAMYDIKVLSKKYYMPVIRKRQDWALWLSILKDIEYAIGIDQSLALYRMRKNSISNKKLNLIRYTWILYKDVEGFSYLSSLYLLFQFVFFYFMKKIH